MKFFLIVISIIMMPVFFHSEPFIGDLKLAVTSGAVSEISFKRYFTRLHEDEVLNVREKEIETSSLIKKFYASRNYQPFWTKKSLPTPMADSVLSFFLSVRKYGLEPWFYRVEEMEELRSDLILETERRKYRQMSLDLEIMLTNSCFLLMGHLKNGVIKTDTLLNEKTFSTEQSNFPVLLERLASEMRFNEIVRLQPENYEYVRLQKAVEKYLAPVAMEKEALEIPDPLLDSLKCDSLTRDILFTKGYLADKKDTDSLSFFNAIKNFQKVHGIQQDGIIGPDTRKALSLSNYDRYLLASINLERLKWDRFSDGPYALINVPSFELKIIEGTKLEKRFKVIVGTTYTRTPNITSEIDQIVTHPIWTLPRSIAVWEILPRIKRNPNYLKRRTYQYYDRKNNLIDPFKVNWDSITTKNFNFVLRQNRGGSNPLGVVKFNFNSPFAIYMHDTPSKDLFNKDIRTLSHGCIRLQDPLKFVDYLLLRENSPGKRDSINNFLEMKKGRAFHLQNPTKLYVRYYTCLAGSIGKPALYKDVYKRDSVLLYRFRERIE